MSDSNEIARLNSALDRADAEYRKVVAAKRALEESLKNIAHPTDAHFADVGFLLRGKHGWRLSTIANFVTARDVYDVPVVTFIDGLSVEPPLPLEELHRRLQSDRKRGPGGASGTTDGQPVVPTLPRLPSGGKNEYVR